MIVIHIFVNKVKLYEDIVTELIKFQLNVKLSAKM